jgi:rhamnosyl/mannosyltransferase
MSKTKLIQLGKYYYPEPGGMETHVYDLCSQLRNNFDIRVVVANTSRKTVIESVEGVKVTRVANIGELFSCPICPTMPYHLRKLDIDDDSIIHLHLPNPMAHFAYLVTKLPGRLVVEWHSDIIRQERFSRLYDRFLHNLLDRASCIVASSPNYVRYSPFLKKYHKKCVVVPAAIRVEKFEAGRNVLRLSNNLRAQYGDSLVLFVGRLIYYKGVDVLLKAAKMIKGKIILVGDGPLRDRYREMVKENGLSDKVIFAHGVSHEELVSYYYACDVFVLPSNKRSEAFGLVQLEAMICGKPVVSTNLTTGVPWVNLNGETGLVVPINHPQKLADAVNKLLENKEERQRLGQNARARVLENFTVEKMVGQMEGVYEQILNGGLKTEKTAAVI